MGDPNNGQVPGGANLGDIRRRLEQYKQPDGGPPPAPPQGQQNPAPPSPPQHTSVPTDGAPISTAVAPDGGGSINPYTKPVANPGLEQTGKPAGGQFGGTSGQGAPAPPQQPTPVKAGAPIGPGPSTPASPQGGQMQPGVDPGRRQLGAPPNQPTWGRRQLGSPMPTPGNPSPNGPAGQYGMGVLKPAVGAPQGGGFQQSNWGAPGSGSQGLPNVPNPYNSPTGKPAFNAGGAPGGVDPGRRQLGAPPNQPPQPQLSPSDQATLNMYGPRVQPSGPAPTQPGQQVPDQRRAIGGGAQGGNGVSV